MVKVYEHPPVEDFSSISAVEAFDECVLCGLSRLGEIQIDAVVHGPLTERITGKFRPVVKADPLEFA
jgi:hypothetical protein